MGQQQPVCDSGRELKHSSCNSVVWVPVYLNRNKRIATVMERHLQTEKGVGEIIFLLGIATNITIQIFQG